MSSSAHPQERVPGSNVFAWAISESLRPLHALIVAPSLLFMATLTLMLFHPPDFNFHSVDRFAFGLLILVMLLRVCVRQQPLHFHAPGTWPMLALLVLAFYGVVSQPNDAETWSLFAAKWLVPFALYQLATYIFDDPQSLRTFETFALIVLGYLSLTAIFFMFDIRQFIFPRYILDEGLGYHADRARGPFLQAVANGVALNLLGLVALNSFRRKRLRGVLALLSSSPCPWLSSPPRLAPCGCPLPCRFSRCFSFLPAGGCGAPAYASRLPAALDSYPWSPLQIAIPHLAIGWKNAVP